MCPVVRPSLLRAVFRMTCWPLVGIAAMDLTVRGLTVLGPLVLERIVLWLIDPTQDTYVGYLWALAMLGIPLASAFLNAHTQGLGIHCYLRVPKTSQLCTFFLVLMWLLYPWLHFSGEIWPGELDIRQVAHVQEDH